MGYLGAAKTPLIYSTNVRDDIAPDGSTTTFDLSQEVPGGSEENIAVLRRKWLRDTLVTAGPSLTINGTSKTLACSTAAVSALLSHIQPPIPNIWPGDTVTISGAPTAANNKTFTVSAVTFDGTTCTITFSGPAADISGMVTETSSAISVVRNYSGPWEYLDSEIDYTIVGTGANYNKQINFLEVPQPNDIIYVLHKGDATYNFAPSANSVGPDQLAPNLRNFACDRFTGNGSTTVFALSQQALTSKSLQVTVDNVIRDGDDPTASPAYTAGEWTLNATTGLDITFKVAPSNGTRIKILHLGFSTVSRRGIFSPGQVNVNSTLTTNSVVTSHITDLNVTTVKIADSNITNAKLANDSVTGAKVLFANNEAFRSIKSGGGNQDLIKLSSGNDTIIDSATGEIVFLANNGTNLIQSLVGEFGPVTHNNMTLGNTARRFSSGWFQGDVNTAGGFVGASANISGNITVAGTVDGIDVSALSTTVTNLSTTVSQNTPPGVGMDYYGAVAPTGWLLCDGAAVSRTTYAALFAVISTTYGAGDGSTTFNLPDCRQRFSLGKSASGTGAVLGSTGGNIDHTHTTPAHTHTMANHTHTGGAHTHTFSHTHTVPAHAHGMSHSHSIPAHYHGMGAGATASVDISHGHGASSVSGTIGGGDGLHTHTGTTDSAGSHTHTYNRPSTTVTAGSGGTSVWDNDNSSTTTSSDGLHSHGFTTTQTGSAHGHGFSLTAGGQSLGATSKSVTGHIGLVSGGVDGNSAMTSGPASSANTADSSSLTTSGQSSITTDSAGAVVTGAPSTNTTDSGGAGTSGTANPPFITVNRIIKF